MIGHAMTFVRVNESCMGLVLEHSRVWIYKLCNISSVAVLLIVIESSQLCYTGVVGRMSRPLVIPEPFTGEGSWDQWIFHFENIAEVNKWDAAGKLQWLKVRLADVRSCSPKVFSGRRS